MKKNVLLILLSAFALTGCELDLGFIKFGDKENTEQKEDQNNQNSQEKPGNNENSGGDNGSSTGDNTGGEKPELNNTYTANIALSGTSFCSKVGIKGTGFQINDSSHAEEKAKIQAYLVSELEYSNLLTSISCNDLNTAPYGSSFCLCVGTRNDNNETGFDEGSFTWNSNAKIYKVEVKARGYYKELGYKDVNAAISIDGDETSLAYDASNEPSYVPVSKEYNEGVKSFTIKSSQFGRVTLESISITWGL